MHSSWFFIGAVFLLAGFVKGVIGLGLPTIAIGLLGLAMPPAQAAALLVVPSFVTNVWQLAAGGRLAPLLRRFKVMLAGFFIGTFAGALVFGVESSALASRLLGATLIAYAVIGLSPVRLSVPPRMEGWLSPWIGIATGMVAVATGVFVVPAVPYLQALKLERDELVQTLGLSFTASTIALAMVLFQTGLFKPGVAGASLLALAPALIGMMIGQALRRLVRPEIFRLLFFTGLLLLGAYLVFR
jgi:uncharacterized protein